MSSKYMRQLDILNPVDGMPSVAIIGTGSIGSFTAMALAKMGVKNFQFWDYDTVEPHNIPNQMFKRGDELKLKVQATEELVKTYAPYSLGMVDSIPRKFPGDYPFVWTEVLIVCPDSMESRRDVWNFTGENIDTLDVKLYIDARMNAELFHVFAFDPHSLGIEKKYEPYLDHDDPDLPCTARAIIYNVLLVAGTIASVVKKYVAGEEYPFHIVFDSRKYHQVITW